MSGDFDVAVVGGGPAGAMAAIGLAEAGQRVILLDKAPLPRSKVCAGGLIKRAAALLPKDLDYPVEDVCETFEMRVFNSDICLSVTRDELVRMVDRRQFDHALVRYAVAKGAELRDGVKVTALHMQEATVRLETEAGPISAGYVILAEGANSKLSDGLWGERLRPVPSIEADIFPSCERLAAFRGKAIIELDAVERGYGWIFAREQHLSVGLVTFRQGGVDLHAALERYLEANGVLHGSEIRNKRGFVIPVKQRRGPFMQGRVLVAGDAAGFADPISAEGFSYALASGRAAAEAVVEGGDDPAAVLALYEAKLERPVLRELAAAERFVRFLYASRRLRNLVMRLYGRRPFRGMADVMEGKRHFADISSPRAILLHLLRLKR